MFKMNNSDSVYLAIPAVVEVKIPHKNVKIKWKTVDMLLVLTRQPTMKCCVL